MKYTHAHEYLNRTRTGTIPFHTYHYHVARSPRLIVKNATCPLWPVPLSCRYYRPPSFLQDYFQLKYCLVTRFRRRCRGNARHVPWWAHTPADKGSEDSGHPCSSTPGHGKQRKFSCYWSWHRRYVLVSLNNQPPVLWWNGIHNVCYWEVTVTCEHLENDIRNLLFDSSWALCFCYSLLAPRSIKSHWVLTECLPSGEPQM
jgi:hypothetical protein